MEIEMNDGLFVYVLFTFQALVVLVLGLIMLSTLCTSNGRASIAQGKMVFGIKFMILSFFCKWLLDTYDFVEQVQKEQEKPFNPYQLLHIDDDGSFSTDGIRKAYRRLAAKYHPDKVNYEKIPRDKALRRFENLQKAYRTLTQKESYDNYVQYGDPEGSKTIRALEIAIPTWLSVEEMGPTVIAYLFTAGVFGLLGITAWLKT